jgi:hypothetical protein
MSARLALQRCWNHPTREAVARCPECGNFFCRECVVEHGDRIICSGCLAKLHAPAERPRTGASLRPLGRVVAAAFGFLLAWFLFFSLGRSLLSLPDRFHADSLWKRTFGDDYQEGRNE